MSHVTPLTFEVRPTMLAASDESEGEGEKATVTYIGNIPHEQQRAHSWISALSPIGVKGPFKIIGNVSCEQEKVYWHFLLFVQMGPFRVIGNISCATFLVSNKMPI
jgi:hypothetical protein